ncbi:MAG: Lrp/AsnC family transcriptional regulator [Desulfurococcales archaeon]|nr:Lrp/AsnC family transcriptional regulator [Desulfurococcales archaeon]
MDLDEKDYIILRMLRRNARTPYSEIARRLGISEVAARKRVLKLIERGVIRRFTIDYEDPGEIRAIVLVKTTPGTKVPEVSRRLVAIEGVDWAYEVTGEYDIIVALAARSVGDINKYIDAIRSVPGVASTYTMIVLRYWTPT